MNAKQLSVFIENRQGRLGEVLGVLKENGINIISLSLADTTEYGLLRLIVNNAEKGKNVLTEKGFSTMLTDIIIIKIENKVGGLKEMLDSLTKACINVEYMYGLTIKDTNAYIVIKPSDLVKATEILKKIGINSLSLEEVEKW